ncbi:hypothetical protein GGF32_003746 [Allomyces javanicus]|nr:hypothetical protein GGF32_003746 [Allomyces javanicus]
MYGAHGYVGRISWYVLAYIADLYPNIIFSSWGSMHDPNLLQLLPRTGTTPPQRRPDGSFLCGSWNCQRGEYVPLQCQGAAYSSCHEFWHVMPDYSPGMDEQCILDFGLPLVVVYIGPAFIPTVMACIERQSSNSTCLFFYWAPETLLSRYPLQAVLFPPAMLACMASFNQCLSIQFDVVDVIGRPIQDIPADFGKTSSFAISLALFALLVVVNLLSLTGLVCFRDDPLIRLQSPALLAAINFGSLASGVGSVLVLMLANALTPAFCAVKMTMSTLGLGIVLAALLAKTWRFFYIFSNLRLSLVVAGRLFRLIVTNKHLALLSAPIISLDVLFFSLWISAMSPHPVQKTSGAMAFTYRCGSLMDLGPAGTAQVTLMTLAMLYHWMLAGVGLILAHRIRSLAMLNNEPTVTMVAMASIMLSAVLVAAIHVLATDPFALVFDSAIVALLSLLVGSVVMSLRPLIIAVDSGGRVLIGSVARAAQMRGVESTMSSAAGTSRRGGDAIGALTKLVNVSLEGVGLDTRDDPGSKAGDHAFLAAVAGASDENMAVAFQAVATAWNGTGKAPGQSVACRPPVLVCTHMGRRHADAWWWTPWQAVTLVLIPPLQSLLVLDRDPWLVLKQQVVGMYGALGYVGLISWYFPSYIIDLYPNIIFSSWGSMRDPNLLQLLPRAGTTPPQRKSDGSYLCSTWYCQNGEYVPPQCQGTAYSTCHEFWHVTPDYSPGMNEQRILDFGLPLVVVYLGPTFIPTVSACIERQSSSLTCLFFYWVPEMLPSRYALQPVHFPPATFPCMAAFNQSIAPSNATSWNCDWETDVLQKVATASIKQRVPPVHSLLLNFVVRDTDIVDMLSDPNAVELVATACAWTREHDLVHFRTDPLIRIQSPALVAAVNLGALISGIGSALDLLSAMNLTPALCTAKLVTSTLGLGIVLVALLAKSWRVFYIFSNLRLSLVVAGRLFRLNVSNKHLALLGTLILALDALLVALWVTATSPRPVQVASGATTFTYRCGSLMDLEPATAVQVTLTSLTMLYDWVLAGFALYLAYRIRSLAMLNNESTVTMIAVASVILPTVLVAAIQITATDPFVLIFDSATIALLSLLVPSVAISLRPLALAAGTASRLMFGWVPRSRRAGTHPTMAETTVPGGRGGSGDAVGALTKLVNASLEDVGIETRNSPSGLHALEGAMMTNIPGVPGETMAAAARTVVTEWHGTGVTVRHSVACQLPVLAGTHVGLRAVHAWWWTPWQAVTLVLIPPLRTLLVLDRDPWED